ncbi:ECF transporter S component [bacterium]|nr:ECF transporter S component [bacterium]
MLKRYTTLEAAFIVLMAACGIALKPVVGPMARLIGSALFIPAGAIAGGIYMLWPLLALLVCRRFGTALLTGIIEGTVILVTGLYGSHGFLSLAIYVLPCLMIDAVYLLVRRSGRGWALFFPPAAGNVTGSLLVGIWIMRIPAVPLLASLVPAFFFGGLGGILAAGLYRVLTASFPQFSGE